MPNKEIEKQYNELRKRYNLPEFGEIDFELEVSDLEETNFLLRNIIRRVAEKLDFYTTLFEGILNPDASNLYAMHETRSFDENEKKRMYSLYTKLMNFNRQSIEVSLEQNEENEAGFINRFFEEWKRLKEELLVYVKKMRASWKEEIDIKEDVGYLG